MNDEIDLRAESVEYIKQLIAFFDIEPEELYYEEYLIVRMKDEVLEAHGEAYRESMRDCYD